MILKVLLTGKNLRIASNISENLETEKNYDTLICAAGKETLFRKLVVFRPRALVICLGSDDTEVIKDYDVLINYEEADKVTVIVVANKDDYDQFAAKTKLRNLTYLARPVSMEALIERLENAERQMCIEKEREEAQLKHDENRPQPEAGPSRGKRKRILVVDDDKEQLAVIKDHLSEFYDVRAVRTGSSALKFLKTHTADLILLDYMMPEMDGPAVLTAIRESEEYPWVPVIFLTGMTERKKVIQTLLDFKPQGYIVKPARKSELIAKIIDVIG